MNGTYTQRRRRQMAGGGITNARQGYLLGGVTDFLGDIKDKIVDDLIPNEIKDSPVGTALVGGALLNQFGLPSIPGLDTKGMGQNWLGDLLGAVVPGNTQFDTVIGNQLPFMFPGYEAPTGAMGDVFTIGGGIGNIGTSMNMGATDLKVAAQQKVYDEINKKLGTNFQAGSNQQQTTTQQTGAWDTGKWGPKPEWQKPLAIGSAIGAADYLTRSDDTMPEQLSIDPSRFATAQAAIDDPNLRFKPIESARLAEGGRIGFKHGSGIGSLEAGAPDIKYEGDMRMASDPGMGEGPFMLEEFLQAVKEGYKGTYDQFIDEIDRSPADYMAQGGRIGYNDGKLVELKKLLKRKLAAQSGKRSLKQEGGLMDLGGMEKDYRQEGGFVPIGGKEKADDVPARLSKNEFVFTADAVRAAGGGDIDAGAQVMENLMENLEAGGKVSEESQGLEGAQAMFANTQKLQNRII